MTANALLRFQQEGWKFKTEEWYNHHNGNKESSIQYQTPRTKQLFGDGVYVDTWYDNLDSIDAEKLYEHENNQVAKFLTEGISNSLYGHIKKQVAANTDFQRHIAKEFEINLRFGVEVDCDSVNISIK